MLVLVLVLVLVICSHAETLSGDLHSVEISTTRSIKTAAYISFLLSAITFYIQIFAMTVTRDTWCVCPAAMMASCSPVPVSGDQCQCPDWRRRKVEVSDSLL